MNEFLQRFRQTLLEDIDGLPNSVLPKEQKAGLKTALLEKVAIAYTLFDDSGKVITVVGGYFMYPNVMELWSFAGREIGEHQFLYARFLKWVIGQVFSGYKLNRMQFTVRASESWAERWIRYLGFRIETCMENYGEDCSTYYLASKTGA